MAFAFHKPIILSINNNNRSISQYRHQMIHSEHITNDQRIYKDDQQTSNNTRSIYMTIFGGKYFE
jgi:hypothetical protein